MKPKLALLPLFAIFLSGPASAYLACDSNDRLTIQGIYQAEQSFGRHDLVKFTSLTHKCFGVHKPCTGTGTVSGPVSFYGCDPVPGGPNCNGPAPGPSASADISYTLPLLEFALAYGANKKRVLRACYERLAIPF